MSTIPVDHHQRSLDALGAADGPFSLRAALDWVFPVVTPELGTVELVDVELNPLSSWERSAPNLRWVRPARITIETTTHTVDIGLSLPWLCDHRALVTTHREPENQLGGHRGLYLGRPLLPRAQLVPRPGLHPRRTATRTLLTLVPDVGGSVSLGKNKGGGCLVQFGRRRARVIPQIAVTRMLEGATVATIVAETGGKLNHATIRRFSALVTDGGSLTRRFAPETLAQIDSVLGLSGPSWAARVAALASAAPGAGPKPDNYRLADELSDESLQLQAVRRHPASHHSCRGPTGLVRFREAEPTLAGAARHRTTAPRRANGANARSIDLLSELAKRLEDQIQSSVDRVVRPGTAGGVIVADDDRGTVAAIEARRTVTRYGSGGLGRLGSHQLWLRGLHQTRRGQLCPLSTPESEDIGLITSFAVGADISPHGMQPTDRGGRFSDLGAAAGLIPFVNHDDPTRASIAARMLRQSVPIAAPRSTEGRDGGSSTSSPKPMGVTARRIAGRVVDVGWGWLTVKPERGEEVVVGFGPAKPSPSAVHAAWRPVVGAGQRVFLGEAVAHAPDVIVEADQAHLAQGRDCLVAYTPWYGWNFEDGIVVSEAIIEAFASEHVMRFVEPIALEDGEEFARLVKSVGDQVTAGDPLAEVVSGERVRRVVRASSDGLVTHLKVSDKTMEVVVELRVPDLWRWATSSPTATEPKVSSQPCCRSRPCHACQTAGQSKCSSTRSGSSAGSTSANCSKPTSPCSPTSPARSEPKSSTVQWNQSTNSAPGSRQSAHQADGCH